METLNEVALEFAKDHHNMYETSNFGSMYFGFIWGAKWQQERMYSEEEVLNIIVDCDGSLTQAKKWFEQYKKK